jgi:hypothetical protein
VNCARSQSVLSARMDGERLLARQAEELEDHLAGCDDCSRFLAKAQHVRRSIRIRAAEDLPDLVEPIMAAVATQPRPRRPTPLRRSQPRSRRSSLGPVAAALVVGLVAGSIAVGGPFRNPRSDGAAAADVVRGVRAAAKRLVAYQARFAIEERGMPGVGTRTFSMDLAFGTPGRYRLDVVDHTPYPAGWAPTDLAFIQNGTATYRRGPLPCPAVIQPGSCLQSRPPVSVARSYQPEAPMVANLILPIDVVGDPHRVTVLATGTVMGRAAVEIELPFWRAESMFPFRWLGGTWRPIFPDDRVTVWLDATNWFLLRATVYPSTDPDRRSWEPRFGLSPEDPATPILDVTATSLATTVPAQREFVIPGGAAPLVVPPADVRKNVGFAPITPTFTAGLHPTATVLPPEGAGSSAPQALLTYSSGLSYLRLGERREPHAAVPIGTLDPTAEELHLANGVAFYEPATQLQGRRLTFHTSEGDLVLESNLSRGELLQVASTLPVRGRPLPSRWRIQKANGNVSEVTTLAHARARTGLSIQLPSSLPTGYAMAGVLLTRVDGVQGVTITFRQGDSDLDGEPIELHVQAGDRLPPAALSTQPLHVAVGGTPARWTPERSELEWVSGGAYRSLTAPGRDLQAALAIADSVPTT